MPPQASPASRKGQSNIFVRLLDAVGSIWFGVVLLVLIFIYATIGSAVPVVRQGYLADYLGLEFLRFEKSEMEWFGWWPFATLIGIFCLSIILVTLRRIRLTVVNAGVWAIHLGIVTMAVACAYYFGTKIEGDAIIFQSRAVVRIPGAPDTSMVVRPDAETTVASATNGYRLRVLKMDPSFKLPGHEQEDDCNEKIWISVSSMNPSQTFVRTMVVGHPEATEDLVLVGNAGLQRAVDATGKPLVDENLQIVLDYDPVEYFYRSHELPVCSNGAIYVRPLGGWDWTELRVDWLPHYFEHISRRDELWAPDGEELPPLRPLDQLAHTANPPSWLKGTTIRVTDYLPYANWDTRAVAAGPDVPANPLLRVRLGQDARSRTVDLLAADPARNRVGLMENFSMRFVWANSAEERARLIKPAETGIEPGLLFVSGPDATTVDALLLNDKGVANHLQGQVGQTVNLLPAMPIVVEALVPTAREERRPAIVPRSRRTSLIEQGKRQSMVRVEIGDGQRIQSEWLRFNEYAFPDAQRNQPGRVSAFSTEVVTLADGRQLEMMYSRQRERLASPVALDRFILEEYPGGDRPEDFISVVRFGEADGWSAPVKIHSNEPARHGNFWYFQSRWDPQTQAHTVLGVGNRNGVGAMLAGVCISIAGMIYAFYVKPVVIWRRKRRALELAAARGVPIGKANGALAGARPEPVGASRASETVRS